METHFKVTGVVLMLLASIHVFFPRYFNWKEELASLTLINRQMMNVHTFFLAFVVFLMGLLCLLSPVDLTRTELGRKITLGLGVFWLVRLFFQLFVYSPELWKGKKFETTIHVLFLVLWAYLNGVFLWAALG